MNRLLLTACALGLTALFATAFEVPRGIHNMAGIEEARAKAAERPEPVAFVITRKSLKETWPTCSGTVSSTVVKALKSFTETIIVDTDTGEQSSLPELVSTAYRSAGGAFPIVVLADPGLKKVYGTFTHSVLKTQDYSSIFRDAKREVRDAVKAGSFSIDLAGGGDAADKDGDAPAEDPVGVAAVEGTEVEDWTSSKGTTIKARLVGVEGDSMFIFETANGKQIRASSDQLSDASVQKARELAGL